MALTPEQQEQFEFQKAIDSQRREHEIEMEMRRTKLETVRLAKETLLENARSKPADSRDITADDITSFASTLHTYINS